MLPRVAKGQEHHHYMVISAQSRGCLDLRLGACRLYLDLLQAIAGALNGEMQRSVAASACARCPWSPLLGLGLTVLTPKHLFSNRTVTICYSQLLTRHCRSNLPCHVPCMPVVWMLRSAVWRTHSQPCAGVFLRQQNWSAAVAAHCHDAGHV